MRPRGRVLYSAQAVLIPVALAVLLTFVLAPAVTWFQRWIGRVPAVLVVVVLAFTILALAGWGLTRQMANLAADLPTYQQNIRQKIADVRGVGKGGAVAQVQETLKDIQTESPRRKSRECTVAARRSIVASDRCGLWGLSAWLGPLSPALTAGLVIIMVISCARARGVSEPPDWPHRAWTSRGDDEGV